jgi:hypothetical protein
MSAVEKVAKMHAETMALSQAASSVAPVDIKFSPIKFADDKLDKANDLKFKRKRDSDK